MSDCEFESDDSGDLYDDDPIFESKEELEDFMSSSKVEKKSDENDDPISFELQSNVNKECVCHCCDDIWSGTFEHICCQQIKK